MWSTKKVSKAFKIFKNSNHYHWQENRKFQQTRKRYHSAFSTSVTEQRCRASGWIHHEHRFVVSFMFQQNGIPLIFSGGFLLYKIEASFAHS